MQVFRTITTDRLHSSSISPKNTIVLTFRFIVFRFPFFNFMCIGILPSCVSVHHVCAWCPQRPGLELQILVRCHWALGGNVGLLEQQCCAHHWVVQLVSEAHMSHIPRAHLHVLQSAWQGLLPKTVQSLAQGSLPSHGKLRGESSEAECRVLIGKDWGGKRAESHPMG